jgi:predicted transcriptional regulator
VAKALLELETLDGVQFKALYEGKTTAKKLAEEVKEQEHRTRIRNAEEAAGMSKLIAKDFFELAAFADAKVLAGERNLGSTVKKVSVLEATTKDDVRRFCAAPNQMMLTSFFGINQNEEAQSQVIEALVAGGTTALVVFHVGQVVSIGKSHRYRGTFGIAFDCTERTTGLDMGTSSTKP